jgi:hypothetical protein
MLNGTQGDIIILRYKTQNRNRMTKSKAKQGIPEGCFNCRFSEIIAAEDLLLCTKKNMIICDLDYKCKKWRIQK